MWWERRVFMYEEICSRNTLSIKKVDMIVRIQTCLTLEFYRIYTTR
jgi:hypothetical protein